MFKCPSSIWEKLTRKDALVRTIVLTIQILLKLIVKGIREPREDIDTILTTNDASSKVLETRALIENRSGV